MAGDEDREPGWKSKIRAKEELETWNWKHGVGSKGASKQSKLEYLVFNQNLLRLPQMMGQVQEEDEQRMIILS